MSYKTGVAGSAAQGAATARYMTTEALKPENAQLAAYYAGREITAGHPGAPTTQSELFDNVSRGLAREELTIEEAVTLLLDGWEIDNPEPTKEEAIAWSDANEVWIEAHGKAPGHWETKPCAGDDPLTAWEDRRESAADDYVTALDFAVDRLLSVERQGGSVASLRRDLDPALADRLGVSLDRPPSLEEIAHLMTGLRADGAPIEGKQVHRPQRSVADIFELDPRRLPTPAELEHVMAGRKGDGSALNLADTVIEGAQKRLLNAYGQPARANAPLSDHLDNIMSGKTATGGFVNEPDVLRALNARRQPVAFVDLTWSAAKDASVAWGLAPTQAERSLIEQIHQSAVTGVMAYVEDVMGHTTIGRSGSGGTEKAAIAYMLFQHYTSRPTAEIAQVHPTTGERYTEFQAVPMRHPDMHLHTHAVTLTSVLTESGRMGSMDLDGLDGMVKEFGGVYQALFARGLRAHGVETGLDLKTGALTIPSIPRQVPQHFSKRGADVENAAHAYAKEAGVDWNSLTEDQQLGFLRKGKGSTRHAKMEAGEKSDFAEWRDQDKALGYGGHRSIMRPDEIRPELGPEERRLRAYEVSLDIIEDRLKTHAKLNAQDFREAASRGLVVAGIGDKPGEDIKAVMKLYRDHGVRQDGEMTRIYIGRDIPIRGRERWSVTTAMHLGDERAVVAHATAMSRDYSGALTPARLDHAIEIFLAKRPDIDQAGPQWQKQREVIMQAGQAARLAVIEGVGGSGKSTMLTPLVAAGRDAGQEHWGISRGWKQATSLSAAGVDRDKVAAASVFIGRARNGKIALGPNSTVLVEELSQLDRGDMVQLMALQRHHGFRMTMIGDRKQGGAIDPGVMELLVRTLGDKVPQILTSVRANTERERQISALFRSGDAASAIAMKRADGTAELVAGGRLATIARVADKWVELHTADPTLRPTIGTTSNVDAHAIGVAVRQRLQAAGMVGPDVHTQKVLQRGADGIQPMPLAIGDRVRVFLRVWDKQQGHFASNGDVLEVRGADATAITLRTDDGRQATVPWDKLKGRYDQTPMLDYGHALTIDAVQGETSRVHIDAILAGSHMQKGGRGYVNESRQVETTFMIVNEAPERRRVYDRIPAGEYRGKPNDDAIWAEVARNISEPSVKALGIDLLRDATKLVEGTTQQLPAGHIRTEGRVVTDADRNAAQARRMAVRDLSRRQTHQQPQQRSHST